MLKTKGSAATPSTDEWALRVRPNASIMSNPGMKRRDEGKTALEVHLCPLSSLRACSRCEDAALTFNDAAPDGDFGTHCNTRGQCWIIVSTDSS